MTEDPKRRTFAEKLDHLFATVHPRGRRPYSMEEVAVGIGEQGSERVSAGYIWMLRKGQRDNPTIKTIEALARFFGVPTAYFFDDDTTERVDSQLELLARIRDAGLQSMAMRGGAELTENQQALSRMIDIANEAMAKMIDVVAVSTDALSEAKEEPPGHEDEQPDGE